MNVPDIDRRGKEDLLRFIANAAAAYTPEWRFDRENPDLGGALALIYTELFAQTLKRFNRVAEKNMAAFFNAMDARLLPALPAEGFVRFGLAGRVDRGVPVPAGTPLLADAGGEAGGDTVFETVDDVLVTPAQPERIYAVCGAGDRITRPYDSRSAGEAEEPFYLFDWKGENLQRHCFSLSHDAVLQLSAGAALEVELVPEHLRALPREAAEALADPGRIVWEYSFGESWQSFAGCEVSGNRVELRLGERQFPVTEAEVEGRRGRWLRLRLREGKTFPPLSLRQVRLSARNDRLLPDLVNASGVDQDVHECFPFGEQLGLFGEVYFGCEEALVKRGAEIELAFNLDFIPVPVEYVAGENPINWKLVMKKTDFRVDEEFDVAIQEVIWEYFNGNGWARLFPDGREADCFNASKGALGRFKTLRFRCPEDLQPVLVNSAVGRFVRARILKIKNLFKSKGNYIVPLIEGPRFSYRYPERGRLPALAVVENNLETRVLDAPFSGGGGEALTPFSFLAEEKPALYFGFATPPEGGPVKLLFQLSESLREKPGRLTWEYWGARRWQSLNVVDETENLRQTGILTMMGGRDFRRLPLWGEELYWLRAVDEGGRYLDPAAQLPRLEAFHMNATRVVNVETRPPERFFIEPEQKDFTCKLLHDRVQRCEVWVDELEELLPAQLSELERGEGFRAVRDPEGTLREAWVRWEEREDFALSGPGDRHYALDRNAGAVRFSDGVNGRIPPAGRKPTILVRYATGGGEAGNVGPGAINRSSRSLGFVNLVENPRRAVGGCDQETFPQAVRRGGAALRHGDRAVTAGDFEALALEATRNIVRAKCFSNRDERGAYRPGCVTLAVLQRDFRGGSGFFPAVRGRVADYILRRCGGNLADLGRFAVIQPRFLELCVKVELTVAEFSQVFPVREEIGRRLDAFLDPLSGNFDGKGWDIGRIPNRTQLRNCLNGVRGVEFLKNVSVSAFAESGLGRVETDLDDVSAQIYALPLSGEHEILITVE